MEVLRRIALLQRYKENIIDLRTLFRTKMMKSDVESGKSDLPHMKIAGESKPSQQSNILI